MQYAFDIDVVMYCYVSVFIWKNVKVLLAHCSNRSFLTVYSTGFSQPVKNFLLHFIFIVTNIFLYIFVVFFCPSSVLSPVVPSPGKDLISGQQLNLTCSPGHPLPSDLRLKWFPPERSSLPSLTPDRHPAYLTIPEAGTGDGGKWRCELRQNSTLLTSAVITLKIGKRRK